MSSEKVLNYLESNLKLSVDRLCNWLAIPSVSTDPDFADDCKKAATWLADQLTSLGFNTELRPTSGHPVVYAHHPGPDNYKGPHILFYGHYDVQPADPIELWDTPPFDPAVVDGPHGKRIVARGAVDDKGQVMMFIEAMRAWTETTGSIPCKITCLIEGEEECGSVNLPQYIAEHKEELMGENSPNSPCDVALICDTGMWDINTPAITYALRGLVYQEIIIHGPSRDLHSGMYGGCVVNPINELTCILGNLLDENRRITIPNFYDDIADVSNEQKEQWANLDFDEAGYLNEAGFKAGAGEIGFTTLERQWARPTCDINGIIGGYTGDGAKTVIPTHASAKISFRLVPDQNPNLIVDAFKKWVEKQVHETCSVEFLDHGYGRPYVLSNDVPLIEEAKHSLKQAMGAEPVLVGCGGSIPIVESFQSILGLESLLIGFGLSDDKVHSPNEKFEVKCFQMGTKTLALLLGKAAGIE